MEVKSRSRSRYSSMKKPPTAPPVYRPQLNAVQAKAASGARPNVPVAPPVYRPQALPRVLQRKVVAGSQQNVHGVLQQRKAPVAPQPHRPQPVPKVLQAKAPVVSSVNRPQAPSRNSVQRQRAASLPHRGPTPPAQQKTIQRYTVVNEHSYNWKVSENGVYVTGTNLSEVYVLAGHTVARSRRTAERVEIQNREYEVWVPKLSVIGDCVACMEEVMHGVKLKYGAPDLSEYRDIAPPDPKLFGESDKDNRERGEKSDLGEKADPGLLEGYVIARQKFNTKAKRPQFHGAAVVAQDGNDDVTMEASAPLSGGISRSRVLPVYDMYNRGKKRKSQSFKASYKKEYGIDASVSVVKKAAKIPKGAEAPPKSLKVIDFK